MKFSIKAINFEIIKLIKLKIEITRLIKTKIKFKIIRLMNFKKLSIISNTPTTITKQEQEQQQQQLIDY